MRMFSFRTLRSSEVHRYDLYITNPRLDVSGESEETAR